RESPLAEKIIDGRYLEPDDTAKVVIGSGLAERLNLKVGRKLAITSADVNGDLVEELCRVAGIFETGADEMDEFLLQAPLALVRRMFRMSADGATQVGIVLTDNRLQQQAFDTIAALAGRGDVVALPWQKVLPELDAYVKLDRGSNIVFHGILIFLILFTILNTLMMSTLERETEFAMLLALGESVWRLRLQTLLEAIGIGFLGSFVGVLIGGALALGAQHWGIDITGLYGEGVSVSGFAFSTRIHAFLDARIIYYSTLIIFASTVALSVITMRHIGRRSLVDILR
ncbi:MAG TPA: FtsX-like permease family protein, partial [candidate division Zixibacteria bacterium]|nr:FtsX-like permease family protein [candidate division Zixibacteria bacterium]